MDNDHVDFIIFYSQEANYNNFMIEFVVAKSLFSQDKALLTSKNGQFFINFWPQLEQYGAVYKTEWKHLQTWSRNLLGKNKRSKFVRILQSESSRHDRSTITEIYELYWFEAFFWFIDRSIWSTYFICWVRHLISWRLLRNSQSSFKFMVLPEFGMNGLRWTIWSWTKQQYMLHINIKWCFYFQQLMLNSH